MINTIVLMLRRPGIVQNIKTISGCDAAYFVDNGAGDPSAALEIRQSRPVFRVGKFDAYADSPQHMKGRSGRLVSRNRFAIRTWRYRVSFRNANDIIIRCSPASARTSCCVETLIVAVRVWLVAAAGGICYF